MMITKPLGATILLPLMFISSAYGAVLSYNGEGKIDGINGINVEDTIYNVDFVDVAFDNYIFNENVFDFGSYSDAINATNALGLVLNDLNVIASDVFGIGSGDFRKRIATPVEWHREDQTIWLVTIQEYEAGWFRALRHATDSNYNLSTNASAVYADWTVASPVPEPTTLALVSLGLAGIGYRRKKAK